MIHYGSSEKNSWSLLSIVKEISDFDAVVDINWNNYVKYLIEYENFKDMNINK